MAIQHDGLAGQHATSHKRRNDPVERAFWRLNDYSHGSGAVTRHAVSSWVCSCGASWAIYNSPPGYSLSLAASVHVNKGSPCPLVGPTLGGERAADERGCEQLAQPRGLAFVLLPALCSCQRSGSSTKERIANAKMAGINPSRNAYRQPCSRSAAYRKPKPRAASEDRARRFAGSRYASRQ